MHYFVNILNYLVNVLSIKGNPKMLIVPPALFASCLLFSWATRGRGCVYIWLCEGTFAFFLKWKRELGWAHLPASKYFSFADVCFFNRHSLSSQDTCLQAKINHVPPGIWYYLHLHIPVWNVLPSVVAPQQLLNCLHLGPQKSAKFRATVSVLVLSSKTVIVRFCYQHMCWINLNIL